MNKISDDSDLTAPSKTPTSARRNEPEATTRSEPSEQKPNSYQPSRHSTSPTKVRYKSFVWNTNK